MNQLVSIVIPTYGRSESLQTAIESACSQTYQKVEIIVVDDNGINTESQKQVEKIVREYGDRVKYIPHEQNRGGSYARNTGAFASNGDYICFLDDDDLFSPQKVEKQLELLEDNPSVVACYCNHVRKNIIENNITSYYSPYSGNILLPVLLFKVDACSGSTLMVRRNIFMKLGGFITSLKRRQDYEFLARLSAEGDIGLVEEPLVTIVTHNGSYKLSKFEDIEMTQLDYLKVIYPLFSKLTSAEINDVLYANYFTLLIDAIKTRNFCGIFRYLKKCGFNAKTAKLLFSRIRKRIKQNR